MGKSQKKFKPPPAKHQPKGLPIIYEDRDILVVNKASGLLSISTDKVKDKTAHFLLNQYVKKGNPHSRNRVYIVHRLDRDTSGILVFAKSESVKRFLQDQWHGFSKKYIAVIRGTLTSKEDIIESYLTENIAHKMYSVDDPKLGKLAKTGYKVIKESEHFSLVEIDLLTGRKNQIRAHFSEKGHPVAGDQVYGKKEKAIKRLTLHAATMTILHPHSKEKMTFETTIPNYFKSLVKG